jgi:hypothetical protein
MYGKIVPKTKPAPNPVETTELELYLQKQNRLHIKKTLSSEKDWASGVAQVVEPSK